MQWCLDRDKEILSQSDPKYVQLQESRLKKDDLLEGMKEWRLFCDSRIPLESSKFQILIELFWNVAASNSSWESKVRVPIGADCSEKRYITKTNKREILNYIEISL